LRALFLATRVLKGVGPRSCVMLWSGGAEDCDRGEGSFDRVFGISSSSDISEEIALWAVEGRYDIDMLDRIYREDAFRGYNFVTVTSSDKNRDEVLASGVQNGQRELRGG
jgi:hypothetical protein